METALNLLMTAPENQDKRMQIVYKEIAKGKWDEACFFLENAIEEEKDTDWAEKAKRLLNTCEILGGLKK